MPTHTTLARRTSARATSNDALTVPAHAAPLLERLTRLRVITAPQAHLLTPALAAHSLRNAYVRLQTLVRQGWLVADAVTPMRGRASAHYYRPSHQALCAMKLGHKNGYLQRPAQHVLEYLLLRAEVYARAVAQGWYIGSPTYLPEDKHAAALAHLAGFLRQRALDRFKTAQTKRASAAQLLELRTAVEQLPHFLPKALTFEFLYRVDKATGRTTEVVLLLVDDVRASVARQVACLPLAAKTDCSIFIRDCDSVFNPDTKSFVLQGLRLGELRRAVAKRFGDALLTTDTHLPNVWARCTRPPQHDTAISAASPNTKEHP